MRNNSHHSKSQTHSFIFFTVGIITFIILIGLTAIIGQFTAVPVSANSGVIIPDDAIRIRIIANSDNEADQELKNAVKDDVAAYITKWGVMPSTYDKARKLILANMPELQQFVDSKLREYGADYSGVVELAEVPFPEKEFENTSYPAGNYEALRITLGNGVGVNWWCVLFPPLCLTAATAPDDGRQVETASMKEKTGVVKTTQAGGSAKEAAGSAATEQPEAKFFLWEMLEKLFAFLKSLFS